MSEQRRADQRCKVSAVITGKFVGRHTGKPRIDFGPESSALFMPMN